jgi:hypothetical protein
VGKLAAFKCFLIFNAAAVIGFILGTLSFEGFMWVFPVATFAWLFANVVGGLSHFASNYTMQQKKDKFVKSFVVFNATGLIAFLVASGMFALALLGVGDATVAWLCGSLAGTFSHFVMNDRAMKLNLGRGHSCKS